MKTAFVYGAGGFIGSYLVKRLRREGFQVRGVDLKYPPFAPTEADDFGIGEEDKVFILDRQVFDVQRP